MHCSYAQFFRFSFLLFSLSDRSIQAEISVTFKWPPSSGLPMHLGLLPNSRWVLRKGWSREDAFQQTTSIFSPTLLEVMCYHFHHMLSVARRGNQILPLYGGMCGKRLKTEDQYYVLF